MNYVVEWTPSALQDLAEIWNTAADRSAVTAAANAIDAALARDALTQGESREGNVRILFIAPLAIFFTVDASSHLVRVHAVWRWPT
jgi:plasmid stabilization system protein ParE